MFGEGISFGNAVKHPNHPNAKISLSLGWSLYNDHPNEREILRSMEFLNVEFDDAFSDITACRNSMFLSIYFMTSLDFLIS